MKKILLNITCLLVALTSVAQNNLKDKKLYHDVYMPEVVIDEIVVEESTVASTTEATQAASTEAVEEEEVVTTTVSPITTQVITTTEPIVQPITLSFIASTGGMSDSTTVNTDDVTDAMWKVIFDSLDGDASASDSTRKKRQLEWDFGAQAAVYFESVTMAVDDVGKSSIIYRFWLHLQVYSLTHLHPYQ